MGEPAGGSGQTARAAVVKHATASVFVFGRLAAGWRTGLIRHPLFGRMMIPGGHVEAGETAAEAAIREVAEEAGLPVRLIAPPAAPLPESYRPPRVPQPWWIVEYQVPADNHLAAGHVHVDHLYVGLAGGPEPVTEPAHPFGWYAAADLAGLNMFDDARTLCSVLLAGLDGAPAAGGPAPGSLDASLAALLAARLPDGG
jgi:8-oxo-dGTP pyrophosphatase MutT (NUDIX family)